MEYCNSEKDCKYKETLSSEYPDGDKKCNKCDWCLYQEYIEEGAYIDITATNAFFDLEVTKKKQAYRLYR